ncbi:unnamed protein product (mitochondrion) [Plasmodiophora brassicae]|uniref:Poly A polymerase head domain-containing protein n=1 Tax=Plasmodiophora brassicae TaxID=37360 RepID=A0A0G4IXI0_PLABS|nr:hypothetical protein PBRA_007485 [Plasmodiophora brassicae]SPQ97086.1 unnamed protein product [Plasmodiophora brassicae]
MSGKHSSSSTADADADMSPTKRARTAAEVTKKMLVRLTPVEITLFGTIRDALDHYKLGTTVRAAGGWVRDKLLGKESKDIDLTVDDMNGVAFARKLQSFARQQKHQRCSNVGVIKANPDQSKHLETATLKLFGIDLDVNSLRTEVYEANSRIPSITQGTALDDALRRDFTINSLFYNVNTGDVEDLTCQGLEDLHTRTLRTPVEPLQTLLDDPLRALRAIRFMGRLRFRFAPKLHEAMLNSSTRMHLAEKVSRERVGIELHKMFFDEHSDAEECARAIVQYKFYSPICLRLPAVSPPDLDKCAQQALDTMALAAKHFKEPNVSLDIPARRLLLFSSFLSPFADMTYVEKGKDVPVIRYIIMEGLKLPNDLFKRVFHLLSNAPQLRMLATAHYRPGRPTAHHVISIGKLLRQMGPDWRHVFAMCHILYPESASALRCLKNWIDSSEIKKLHKWTPLLNGNDIKEKFGVTGPQVGELLERQFEWRVLYPLSNVDEVTEFLTRYVQNNPPVSPGSSCDAMQV